MQLHWLLVMTLKIMTRPSMKKARMLPQKKIIFLENKLKVFGPKMEAAQLESSKDFAPSKRA